MRVAIETETPLASLPEDMVGNVYQVRGGTGAARGHLHIIVSSYETRDKWTSNAGFATLTIDRDGQIIGGNSYAHHYFMDKVPVARCDGLESVALIVRSL